MKLLDATQRLRRHQPRWARTIGTRAVSNPCPWYVGRLSRWFVWCPAWYPAIGISWHSICSYCYYTADREAFYNLSKAWVPEKYSGVELWFYGCRIDQYINTLFPGEDSNKLLRLALIACFEDQFKTQLLFPPGLLSSASRLDLRLGDCSPTLSDMGSYGVPITRLGNTKGRPA